MAPARAYAFLALCLLVCVYSLPAEPKFRQMSLQEQEVDTSAEIQAISARITFLQKLNKLTYDTTLFTRKLRWLLRRSLTEKPSVADVADLMNKELAISKAQIEVAVEGVADELRLEVNKASLPSKPAWLSSRTTMWPEAIRRQMLSLQRSRPIWLLLKHDLDRNLARASVPLLAAKQ